MAAVPENEYEAKRERIMAKKREKMQQLGLVQAVEDMKATAAAGKQRKAPAKRPRAPQARVTRHITNRDC